MPGSDSRSSPGGSPGRACGLAEIVGCRTLPVPPRDTPPYPLDIEPGPQTIEQTVNVRVPAEVRLFTPRGTVRAFDPAGASQRPLNG